MLGCVPLKDYKVAVVSRSGTQVGMFDMASVTDLRYGRKLDDAAPAELVFNITKDCKSCELLQKIDPIATSLVVYRGKDVGFYGPITTWEINKNQATVTALDKLAYLDWRVIHSNHKSSAPNPDNLVDYCAGLIEDALGPDAAGLKVVFESGNVVGERETLQKDYRVAQDEVAEILRTDVDMVLTGNTIRLFGTEAPFGYINDLSDKDFVDNVRVKRDGLKLATRVIVKGGGALVGVYPSDNDEGSSVYGLKERVFNEPSILDQKSLDAAAKSRYDLLKTPVTEINIPAGAQLSAEADLLFSDLTPGVKQRIVLRNFCVPVSAVFRLIDVTVNVSSVGEKISCSWQPVGTVVS